MTLALRLVRPPGRYLRRAKGSLFIAVVCISVVGLFVVSQFDVSYPSPNRGHLAQRVLQQLQQPCTGNCSGETGTSNEVAVVRSDEISSSNKFLPSPALGAKHAEPSVVVQQHASDLTPEEDAIPEELAPDVEPPQVQHLQVQTFQNHEELGSPGAGSTPEKANNNPEPLFADAKVENGADAAAPAPKPVEVEEPAVEVEDERHLDEVAAANQESQQKAEEGTGNISQPGNNPSLGNSGPLVPKKDDNRAGALQKDILKPMKLNTTYEGQVVAAPAPSSPPPAPQVKKGDISQAQAAASVPNANVTKPVSAPAVIRKEDLPAAKSKKENESPLVSSPAIAVNENPPVVTRQLYEPGHNMPGATVCRDSGRHLKLLVLVTTAPGHVNARQAVRGTWGHVALRHDVALAFFVGKTSNATEQAHLQKEDMIFGDIIQGNFQDSYNNLTLKTISMLEWVKDHCSEARFVLKTDDDMYIHMPKLFAVLDKAQVYKRTILGKVAKKWKPIRNVTSKYYISPKLFKENVYPDFNTGPAYILTNDVIAGLYEGALKGTFFKLEDVYVTGTIAKQLKVNHVHFNEFVNRRIKLDTCAVQKSVSIHMVKPFEMYDLWKRLSDGLTTCPPEVTTTTKKATAKPTTRTTASPAKATKKPVKT